MNRQMEYATNEYGTTVTVHHCSSCGARFTVCPPVTPDRAHNWDQCLATTCTSYDESRDADKLFDQGLAHREEEEDQP